MSVPLVVLTGLLVRLKLTEESEEQAVGFEQDVDLAYASPSV